MKAQNTLTFIISRNYGHPLSFSLPVWRVYLAGALAVLLIFALLGMSVLFLGVYPRMLNLERERDQLKNERDDLRHQILSANQKFFDLKEEAVLLAARVTSQIGSPPTAPTPKTDPQSSITCYPTSNRSWPPSSINPRKLR